MNARRQRPDKASKLFELAVSIAPKDASTLLSYAIFLKAVRHDYEECERM